ncbi:class I SAM-dependent methyltransferase [Nocardia sp. NPDC127526]|uniref:class I SAM-dependent methyltransferase n=1 Tax=Nocardia sp. NPDC127526 TaxID=3345393 RepID=UPI00363AB6EC
MAYEHALAYVLGLEGVALLRAFAGEHDRAFTEARIAEIRKILDDGSLDEAGEQVEHVDVVEGYGIWAAAYDSPGNPAFDYDAPLIRAVAAELPTGVALDAACGTGRVSATLAECGYAVLGVDRSPEMLELARKRLPEGDFRVGGLEELPVGDDAVDIVTCSLALSHVPDLRPVFAEFARVLRPGGHLVIADVHPEQVARTHVPTVRRTDGTAGRVSSHHHRTGDYVRAALAAGFRIRSCEEPTIPPAAPQPAAEPGPWEIWPWSLTALVPEAARAANAGVPGMLLWHMQLTRPDGR